jgi:hypothetical protein
VVIKNFSWLAVVVHTYNPSYLGSRNRRIEVGGSPGKKSMRFYLKNQQGGMVHNCNPSYSRGKGRRISV